MNDLWIVIRQNVQNERFLILTILINPGNILCLIIFKVATEHAWEPNILTGIL